MKYFYILLLFILNTFTALAQSSSKTDEVIFIQTDLGEIVFLLYDTTSAHKKNFLKLAKEGFYNGTTFHRVIDGFMIQGGDLNSKDSIPGNDGQGGPGYTIPAEFVSGLTHQYGAVAAARMGDAVNPKKASSGSQFYIVENKEGAHFLDNNYTVFGQVIKGMDVVEKIAEQPKGAGDRPLKDVTMTVSAKKMKKTKIGKKYQTSFYE